MQCSSAAISRSPDAISLPEHTATGMTPETAAALAPALIAAAAIPVVSAMPSMSSFPGPPSMGGRHGLHGDGRSVDGVACGGPICPPSCVICCVCPSLSSGSLPFLTKISCTGFGMPSMSSNVPPSQQATRHARRVYVGGLPPTANEQSIATFFSHALAAVGGNVAGPGAA